MTLQNLALILITVSASAIAQILLKLGMSRGTVAQALLAGEHAKTVIAALTSPFVLGGLSLYAGGAVLWLIVLSKVDVSVAYPFVGVSFVATMLLAAWFLGEEVGMLRVVGTLLITVGSVFVVRSA